MIESLFKQKSTLARLQSGPLAQHLPLIAEVLRQEGYPPETIRRYVRVADGFGRWLRKSGLPITAVDETTLARYRSSTGRRQKGQLRAAGRGLAKVLALLRKQNAVAEPVRAADTEGDALVAAFDSHLEHVAGLMPGTRSQYLRSRRRSLSPWLHPKRSPISYAHRRRNSSPRPVRRRRRACGCFCDSWLCATSFPLEWSEQSQLFGSGNWHRCPSTCPWMKWTGRWQLVTRSHRLESAIALSCSCSFGLGCGLGKSPVFAFQISTGEKGSCEFILRNPRANESCPYRMMLAKLWRNTCEIVAPRVLSLTSSYAPARRSAPSLVAVPSVISQNAISGSPEFQSAG